MHNKHLTYQIIEPMSLLLYKTVFVSAQQVTKIILNVFFPATVKHHLPISYLSFLDNHSITNMWPQLQTIKNFKDVKWFSLWHIYIGWENYNNIALIQKTYFFSEGVGSKWLKSEHGPCITKRTGSFLNFLHTLSRSVIFFFA